MKLSLLKGGVNTQCRVVSKGISVTIFRGRGVVNQSLYPSFNSLSLFVQTQSEELGKETTSLSIGTTSTFL